MAQARLMACTTSQMSNKKKTYLKAENCFYSPHFAQNVGSIAHTLLRRNTDLFELLTAPVTGTSEHATSGAVPLHATNLPEVSGGGTTLLLRLT